MGVAESEQGVEYKWEFKCDQCDKIFADNIKVLCHMGDVHSDKKDCSLLQRLSVVREILSSTCGMFTIHRKR